MVTPPPDFTDKLQESLRAYAEIKAKFDKKFRDCPFEVIKLYNYDEMQRIKRNFGNDVFIEKAYLLGFRGVNSTYKKLPNQEITVFGKACDYVNLFFNYEDTMHQIITERLKTPIDLMDYLMEPTRFKVTKRSRTLKYTYEYLNHLGE